MFPNESFFSVMAKSGVRKRRQDEKDSGRVVFSAEGDKEYTFPYRDRQGTDFESLVSGTNNSGFLDEIALLKKGIITKDTPKHTYRRSSAEPIGGPVDDHQSPITMAELNTRGLRLSKDRVIYSVPEDTLEAVNKIIHPTPRSSDGSTRSESSATKTLPSSVQLSDGGGKAIEDCIDQGTHSKEYYVGNPGENARLRISQLKDGYRIQCYYVGKADERYILQ
ncbi:hypothetical protein GCK32_000535 [Trichostrongylus colubriformis]|uniref:Uncharacterized protein n=1 Tax=Trichostrongylus colubriformis TaxID=6319 RepID=A0AAN8G033_TRICO